MLFVICHRFIHLNRNRRSTQANALPDFHKELAQKEGSVVKWERENLQTRSAYSMLSHSEGRLYLAHCQRSSQEATSGSPTGCYFTRACTEISVPSLLISEQKLSLPSLGQHSPTLKTGSVCGHPSLCCLSLAWQLVIWKSLCGETTEQASWDNAWPLWAMPQKEVQSLPSTR